MSAAVGLPPLDLVTETLVRRSPKSLKNYVGRLQRAAEAGNRHRTRHLIQLMLNSNDCRFAALRVANRSLKAHQRQASLDLVRLASTLDPWRGSDEPVTSWLEEKRTGGHRIVFAFGLERKALQVLVSWAIRPWIMACLHPSQRMFTGGRNCAARDFATQAQEGGHRYAFEIDIKDFYPSIDTAWLRNELPLPPTVFDSVCTIGDLRQRDTHIAVPIGMTSKAGRIVPQGSIVSPLLAEFAVASLLPIAEANIGLLVYADNFIWSACTKQGATMAQADAVRWLATSPAGAFVPRPSHVAALSAGFSALGYTFIRRRRRIDITVSEGAQERFADEVSKIWDEPGTEMVTRILEATEKIKSWRAAQAAANTSGFVEALMNHLSDLVPNNDLDHRTLGAILHIEKHRSKMQKRYASTSVSL